MNKSKKGMGGLTRFILFVILYGLIAFLFPYPWENAILLFLSAWLVFLLPIFIIHCVDVLFYDEDWIFKKDDVTLSNEDKIRLVRETVSEFNRLKANGTLPEEIKTIGQYREYLDNFNLAIEENEKFQKMNQDVLKLLEDDLPNQPLGTNIGKIMKRYGISETTRSDEEE
tara:strand:+ start:363 stop:872 length:510 start_codon:yes stop_codon:yes gene_type:complete